MQLQKGKRLLFDLALISAILVISVLGLAIYLNSPEFTVSNSEQFDNIGGIPIISVNLNATATVFSAQNQIAVSVIAYVPNSFPTNLTEVYVGFPYASLPNPKYDAHGSELNSFVTMKYDAATKDFRGSTTLVYNQEGAYCAVLYLTSPIQYVGVTGSANSCQGYPTMLVITTADSLYQLQASKTNLGLTWVLLALTVIFVREFGETIYRDYSRSRRKEGEQADTQTKDNHSEGDHGDPYCLGE